MPIIWRYLLSHFLTVLVFCVIAFIAILLTTRLDEIAHFATMGPESLYVIKFTLYQIPYILPIALPISCLISSILLIQRLSRSHELTALRASGMSLSSILMPILLAAFVLSLFNFYIVSEVSTHSHLSTSLLKNELRSINPLLLLHNKHLMKLKGFFFNAMGPSKLGEMASDVIIALPNKDNNRVTALFAKNLYMEDSTFVGENMTLVSSLDADDSDSPDSLVVENIDQMRTPIYDFTQMMQKKVWSLSHDHLSTRWLLIKLKEEKDALTKAREEQKPAEAHRQIKYNLNRCYSELMRRISLAAAVFTFTLMGAAFSISIARNPSGRSIFFVIALVAFYLVAFFEGKGVDHLPILSTALYLIPHLIIVTLSFFILYRVNRGIG
jgi:lipopolysaccharide export system permease protein